MSAKIIPIPSTVSLPSKMEVVDHSGNHLLWADDELAHELLHRGQVRISRRGKTRLLVSTTDQSEFWGNFTGDRGTLFAATRYSHNKETKDNPPGVWTFKHLPKSTAPAFLTVAQECGAARRHEHTCSQARDWKRDEASYTTSSTHRAQEDERSQRRSA
jgi:hypothetical protein